MPINVPKSKDMVLSKRHKNIPLITMIAANLVPIYGVLIFHWSVYYILLLYWSENVIIGFYNVLKMALAKGDIAKQLGKLFVIPFFIMHYGGFVGAHGLFIMALAGPKTENLMGKMNWPCFLVFVQLLLNVLRQVYLTIPTNMKLAILAIFVSHGVGFVHDYILTGEYKTAKIDKLMNEPYKNIVLMHVAIIFGGFLTMAMGGPVGVLLVIVGGKTYVDAQLYLRRQQKKQKQRESQTESLEH